MSSISPNVQRKRFGHGHKSAPGHDAASNVTPRVRTMTTATVIAIRPERVAFVLGAVVVVLVMANITFQLVKFYGGHKEMFGLVHEFNLNREANIPTYFSSLTLFLAAALLGGIAIFKKRTDDSYARHWTILSIIFFLLSVDELASLHELLIPLIQAILGSSKGILRFAWVIPAGAAVLLFALSYLKFLFHLPTTFRLLFATAGIVYVGGALILEIAGGFYANLHGRNFTYNMIGSVEETLEMAGIVIFIYALLKYVSVTMRDVSIRVESQVQN